MNTCQEMRMNYIFVSSDCCSHSSLDFPRYRTFDIHFLFMLLRLISVPTWHTNMIQQIFIGFFFSLCCCCCACIINVLWRYFFFVCSSGSFASAIIQSEAIHLVQAVPAFNFMWHSCTVHRILRSIHSYDISEKMCVCVCTIDKIFVWRPIFKFSNCLWLYAYIKTKEPDWMVLPTTWIPISNIEIKLSNRLIYRQTGSILRLLLLFYSLNSIQIQWVPFSYNEYVDQLNWYRITCNDRNTYKTY